MQPCCVYGIQDDYPGLQHLIFTFVGAPNFLGVLTPQSYQSEERSATLATEKSCANHYQLLRRRHPLHGSDRIHARDYLF